MPEFLELLPPPEALRRLFEHAALVPTAETIRTETALGRVTAAPVIAAEALPAFPRSTVDGYAVRAHDTYGASETLPAYLTIAGEVQMGTSANITLLPGQCCVIHTGGMLPDEADAVVMIEHTQITRQGEIECGRAVAVGENVLNAGEDVAIGQEVIQQGVRLRPAEIGGLMALGITELPVARKPVVGLISSGDEVVPPDRAVSPGQVRDVNAYTLSALVEAHGGSAIRYGIAPDNAQALEEIARQALAQSDVLVITAGSSASVRDLTSTIINRLGAPGVLVHGVNVRPGKPTILAMCDGKVVIGLPGNPVSALVIAGLFVVPVIEALLGVQKRALAPVTPARLATNVPSQAGREDWVPVHIRQEDDMRWADPLFGKSNLIFTLARADGLVRVPPDATGLSAGEWVEVYSL